MSELDYERRKSARLAHTPSHTPSPADLAEIDRHAAQAAARGAAYITIRRLAELLGARRQADLEALRSLLGRERATRMHPPVFRTR